MTSGKTVALIGANERNYTYLKFKANQTGYLKLTIADSSVKKAYLTLCDSSRKALSSSKGDLLYAGSTTGNEAVVYGVQKGKTYFVRVKTGFSCVRIKAIFKSVTEKSGSKKSDAVKLTSGKAVSGTILAGSSDADWYKFKLSAAKKVTVSFKGNTNNRLKFTVYDSNGKKITSGSRSVSYSGFSGSITSSGKLPKGTYYIKVERYDRYSSGNYTLSYK